MVSFVQIQKIKFSKAQSEIFRLNFSPCLNHTTANTTKINSELICMLILLALGFWLKQGINSKWCHCFICCAFTTN